MNILLIGYMGSGKSTIGKKLSSVLGFEYLDLDTYIEEKENLTISDIFKSKGEIYFRKIENEYLKNALTHSNAIIALGGGTPCYGDNMNIIVNNENTKSIYLKASIPQLVKRLDNEKIKRPLISHLKTGDDLTEFIGKHLFERSSYYSQSDIAIQTDYKSVNEIVEEIILKLF